MAHHVFMQNGEITKQDIERIIELTNDSKLVWRHSNNSYAFHSDPAIDSLRQNADGLEKFLGGNLHGVRVGYNPKTKFWHYLRLLDKNEREHYVDEESLREIIEITNRLYATVVLKVAQKEGAPGSHGLKVNV